ncbi:hypothetical protein SBA3_3500005 [Candidatus Sulfopaludibacter sp. SbA3]|nr:hypothetical protein SBA3_3500005 [Candidatus Sulfopaludibacter sp. SbA3]
MGMAEPDHYFAHHPQIDAAFAQAVTWACEAKNLNLMSLYESRAQRRVERNMKMLKDLQAERKSAFNQIVEDATLLALHAAAKGEPYDVERDFPPEALPPQFAFSLPKIAHLATHNLRLADAKKQCEAARQPLRKAA